MPYDKRIELSLSEMNTVMGGIEIHSSEGYEHPLPQQLCRKPDDSKKSSS